MTPPAGRSRAPQPPRHHVGRAVEIAISLYGATIFIALWVGIVVGTVTGGSLFGDAWSWITSLDQIAAVVVWILLLPIAIALWAYDAALSPVVMAVVMLGLVGWTLLAAAGLVKTFRRR